MFEPEGVDTIPCCGRNISNVKTTTRYAPSGYVYVDRQLAETMFALGFEVTFHMNNINSEHVFKNWCLGVTLSADSDSMKDNLDHQAWSKAWDEQRANGVAIEFLPNLSAFPKSEIDSFKDAVDMYVSYNRGELGRYPVFCVKGADYGWYRWLRSAAERLAYLKREILAERISYGEIAELQDLAPCIPDDDVILREWAGIPEHA